MRYSTAICRSDDCYREHRIMHDKWKVRLTLGEQREETYLCRTYFSRFASRVYRVVCGLRSASFKIHRRIITRRRSIALREIAIIGETRDDVCANLNRQLLTRHSDTERSISRMKCSAIFSIEDDDKIQRSIQFRRDNLSVYEYSSQSYYCSRACDYIWLTTESDFVEFIISWSSLTNSRIPNVTHGKKEFR